MDGPRRHPDDDALPALRAARRGRRASSPRRSGSRACRTLRRKPRGDAARQLLSRHHDHHALERGLALATSFSRAVERQNASFAFDGSVIVALLSTSTTSCLVGRWAALHGDALAANWERARLDQPWPRSIRFPSILLMDTLVDVISVEVIENTGYGSLSRMASSAMSASSTAAGAACSGVLQGSRRVRSGVRRPRAGHDRVARGPRHGARAALRRRPQAPSASSRRTSIAGSTAPSREPLRLSGPNPGRSQDVPRTSWDEYLQLDPRGSRVRLGCGRDVFEHPRAYSVTLFDGRNAQVRPSDPREFRK